MDMQETSKTIADVINVTDAARHKISELLEGADADIEAVGAKVIDKVTKASGGVLRG